MIPPNTFRAIVVATNIAWYSGCWPFRFVERKKGLLEIEPSFTSGRSIYFHLSYVVNCFYVCFIAFRVFQKVALENEETSLAFLIPMGYLFLSYTMTVILQYTTMTKWEEIPRFLISYIKFFREIKAIYILPGERGPRCIKFCSAILTIGILVNLQNIVIIMKKPDRLHFLTSLVAKPSRPASLVFRIPFLLIQAWIWISTWAHVWAFCFHIYAYISCLVFIVREIDLYVKTPRTNNMLREPQTLFKILRTLQMLHRLWQTVFQDWFIPSNKACAIAVGTLASYGVIKLSGPRSLVMGCMATLSLLYLWTMYRKFGQLHELSVKMLENWRHAPNSTKRIRKFVESVPVFRIDIGCFYYVHRTTVATVLETVLNNTITLLFL
ncbi:hypothetical protein Ocin01_03822 [Orchesella cincta]|uniref:Uncharacterized protein n=1 Tax=Orchesella cincta TaxID=48709 RepID=A0A1D2NC94_ORCCI|nr:hypothetical protein Ocin01_03822 [Orchesella cincta]